MKINTDEKYCKICFWLYVFHRSDKFCNFGKPYKKTDYKLLFYISR